MLKDWKQLPTLGNALSKIKPSTSASKEGKKRSSSKRDGPEEKKLYRCKYFKKLVTHKANECWDREKKPGWLKQKKFSSTNKKTPSLTGKQVNSLIQLLLFLQKQIMGDTKPVSRAVLQEGI